MQRVSIGAIDLVGTLVFVVGSEAPVGAPINQSFCQGTDAQYPLAKSEVAKITFYEGGARGYYAKRSKRGSTLQLYSFAMTDGLCDPSDGCHQPNDRYILKITIPANATIVEQMEARPAGATEFKPFNCNPTPAP